MFFHTVSNPVMSQLFLVKSLNILFYLLCVEKSAVSHFFIVITNPNDLYLYSMFVLCFQLTNLVYSMHPVIMNSLLDFY